MEYRKFGTKDQIGFWFGDMAGSFVNLYFDSFFLLFCTYVLAIDPKFMATMFLGARLFDAFNDPVIGSLPDRFKLGKTRDKYKPYIKLFMLPLALSAILGFWNVSGMSIGAKHVWVVLTYVLYGVSYTGTSMPFGAMASVVTENPVERTKLSRARAFGGMAIGYGYLSLIPQFIWDKNNNPIANSYLIFGVVSAIGCIICYNVLFKFTQERLYSEPKKSEYSYMTVIKGVLKNRAMLGIMLASVGSLIQITGNSQFGGIMFREFYNMPKALTLSTLGSLPIYFIMFPLVPKYAAKWGKKKLLLRMLFVNLLISIFLFVVTVENVYLYIFLYIISSVGQATFIMLVWAFVTDAIDYAEYITGIKAEGSLYSIYTFSRKIGSTIASVGVSSILSAIGFVSGATSQTPEVVESIRLLGTGVPVIAVILEIVGIAFVWNFNKEYKELKDIK